MMEAVQHLPIAISNLLLGYNHSDPLLPAFSVDAHKGEFIALIGRNGVGKSTFIRTIYGVQHPLNGTITLNGISNAGIPRTQRAKLIAYVPSEQLRIPNLYISDFVALARFPHLPWPKILTVDDWSIVHSALTLVGIDHLAQKDVTAISDGERQRAMIAFALAQDSDIILMDEPTAFLDLPNKFEIVRLLAKLTQESGKTIIYSTHDLQGAIAEVDTIWLMLKQGFVSGCPEDIALNNHFQRMLGDSHMVFEKETGIFKSFRDIKKTISLQGNGEYFFWTKRMLERLGFSIGTSGDGLYRVECPQQNTKRWTIYKGSDLCHQAENLTEIARWLAKQVL